MKVFKRGILVLFVALLAGSVYAQESYDDAVNIYNTALEQAKAKNYDAAISSYEKAASIGASLGTQQGTDIKTRAEQQIPKVALNKAASLFNGFKQSKQIADLDKAIDAFKNAGGIAKQYNDQNVERTAVSYVPQLYYQKAIMLFNRENYEQADVALNEAIRANSNYALPYYQKGLVVKKTSPEDLDGILNWFDQAIAIGEQTNQGKVVRRTNQAAHDELLFRGAKSIEAKSYAKAIELLKLALTYESESADVHYRLAEAYNKRSEFDKAIASANQALEFENGGKTDRAKIYFELGLAYQSKSQKAEACKAYTDALYGSFKGPAEHAMEFELKCKSAQ
ncbi:tetratricopeptide repeat protein [Balneola vulgaris]|uniref:tetratricopeptide repeat protein n=1 Tax=Balneola vulgaris TaxID=287535 RepID=UPI00036BB7F5|nr:tetratricopeptide repeat protein [Balneola vulgaris]